MVETTARPSLLEIVGEVLELDPDELDDDTSPDNTMQWNSISAVRLVVVLQEAYDIEFTNAEILAMRSVALIRRVLRKRGIRVQ